MTRIYSKELKEGIIYSAPLFFDDGVNMFLAKRRALKKYHIDILKKWSIPFIITYGTVIDNGNTALLNEGSADLEEIEPLEELMELQEEEEKKKTHASYFLRPVFKPYCSKLLGKQVLCTKKNTLS